MQSSLIAPELDGIATDMPKGIKICFVCTGNTCRSPMAAATFNHLTKGSDKHAVSMGLYAYEGMPVSTNAVEALSDAGVISDEDNPYTEHRATACSLDSLSQCDYIVGISESHTMELIARYPQLVSRILSMPKGISDPYGGSLEVYKRCLCEITQGIKELFSI